VRQNEKYACGNNHFSEKVNFSVFCNMKACSSGYRSRTACCYEPGYICTRLHRATPKKTVTSTFSAARNSPLTPLGITFFGNVDTHVGSAVPQYITTRTRTSALEQCSWMSTEHATACQTHTRGKNACVLIAHLYRPRYLRVLCKA
jgi:hypothetical protein